MSALILARKVSLPYLARLPTISWHLSLSNYCSSCMPAAYYCTALFLPVRTTGVYMASINDGSMASIGGLSCQYSHSVQLSSLQTSDCIMLRLRPKASLLTLPTGPWTALHSKTYCVTAICCMQGRQEMMQLGNLSLRRAACDTGKR